MEGARAALDKKLRKPYLRRRHVGRTQKKRSSEIHKLIGKSFIISAI